MSKLGFLKMHHSNFLATSRRVPGQVAFVAPSAYNVRLPLCNERCFSRYPKWRCSTDNPRKKSRRAFNLLLLSTLCIPAAAKARQEGVNRPDLLPKEQTPVIDLERFLASGEARRLRDRVTDLEKRTGFKVRVLTQRFPQTPGLAVRDYWGVNDDTVVMVADYFGGAQLLKFNVGRNVDVVLPPRFWSVLASQYGNKFYVEKNGEAAAILNSVEAIRVCLLRNGCATPPNLDSNF